MLIAVLLFCFVGFCFVMFGLKCKKSKVPVGFWANAESPKKVNNLQEYNNKVGNLWIIYGLSFIPLSLPLLGGQNSGWVILTVLGVVMMTLAILVRYSFIESKYVK